MSARVHVLHAGLAITLIACALWVPPGWRAIAIALSLFAFAALVAYLVWSPRTQWFVPTIVHGDPERAAIALTFDDGPDPDWTPRVLDVLAEHGAKATFFVVGARAEAHPELLQRMVREGHTVGCHSHTHAMSFHFWSARAMAHDLERAQAVLTRVLGAPSPWFRPPQGIRTPQLAAALTRLHTPVRCVTWSARGNDALPTRREHIERRLLPALTAGAILTLHDGTGLGGGDDRSVTIDALRTLLTQARERQLSCVNLADLLRLS